MSQNLTIKYTPTQQDYARVLRLFFIQRTGTRISLAFLVIAFCLIVFAILSKGSPPTIFELVWLFLPPLFLLFIFFVQPSRVARQAAKNKQLICEAIWEVNHDGVQISSSFGSTLLDWAALSKLVTYREYYLLLLKANKNAFRFLPLRAFASQQEQDQFLELMANHLSKK